ncbi:MAG: response regulator [Candidatus Riflebacteria bacterium]|nr:response regulator [Candidatus Riflebacteria bacterium]
MKTILIVDDQEINRDILFRRLSKRGFNALAAADANHAIEFVNTQKIDLIILDVMMPGIDGIELLQILRKEYSPGKLPIIMATAKDESDDIVQALSLGANDYVTKPIDFEILIARVMTQLNLKDATEELERRDAETRKELEIAQNVQRSLLPDRIPHISGFEIGINFTPCYSIGGDFYDFYEYSNSEFLGLFFADISGHGVAGALLMSMLKALASDSFQVLGNSAEKVLLLNDRLLNGFPDGKFVSAIYGMLDSNNKEFCYINAAPESIALFSKTGELIKTVEGGQPLGFFHSKQIKSDCYIERKVCLNDGETLFLFTDGVTELMNEKNEMLEFSGFERFVKEELNNPVQIMVDNIYRKAIAFSGRSSAKDDIMIFAIKAK